MNLVPVPESRVALLNRHLYKGGQELGSCVNVRTTAQGAQYECGATVKAGTGFADTHGTPFVDYYCPRCADEIRSRS